MPLINYVYIVPAYDTSVTVDGYTAVRELGQLKNCDINPDPGVVPDIGSSWNCTRCGNDMEYYQPVTDQDTFMLQFRMSDAVNVDPCNPTDGWNYDGAQLSWAYWLKLYDCDGTLISDDMTEFTSSYIVYTTGGVQVQQVTIDMAAMLTAYPSITKFYFEILKNLGGSTTTAVTEPYEVVNTCTDTVLLTSTHQNADCIGRKYSAPDEDCTVLGTYVAFDNSYRVYGTIDDIGISITEQEYNRGRLVSGQQFTRYRFRTIGIPPYVAQLIASHMTGQTLTIGDVGVQPGLTIDRNNDEGRSYYIDVELDGSDICNINNTCNL